MKYLILSVVVLAIVYSAQAKTVEECTAAARRCKAYVAPLAGGGNSREGFLRKIRTTPINDICAGARAFLNCNGQILEDPECNIHDTVNKYQALYEKLTRTVQFICVREKDAVERAIPCMTSRQFFGKIARCKRTHACNTDDSWNCAKLAVAATCDAATSAWFDGYVPLFKQNHPGCGEDSLLRKFYGAMRQQ
jgi:hypothetical protein